MKLAIFDLDGTLVESLKDWRDISINFLKRHNIDYSKELEMSMKTLSFTECAKLLVNEYNIDANEQDIIDEWINDVKYSYDNTISLKPYAKDYVKYLCEKGVKMCIATAAEKELAENVTKRLDIYDYMDFIITVNEFGKGKESPEIFLYCKDKYSFDIDDCVVFEDSLYAIKSAKSAGFKVIGLRDLIDEENNIEIEKHCDKIISNFKELL